MILKKQVTRTVGLAAMAGLVLGFAVPAQASPVPPKASAALSGTWVNVNSGTHSVKQVVVAPSRNGSVSVDAFGSCTPTLCEWGRVPAIVYGTNVSSTTGATFQTRQFFVSAKKEWSRTTLFGSLAKTKSGLRLTLRELTVFEDGSGRRNYGVTENFVRRDGKKATINGHSGVAYPHGAAPALTAGALGNWKNVNSATRSLVKIKVSGSTAHPVVTAYGACSPNPCNWGGSRAITYGTSISSTHGATLLAPYTFSFKKSQLLITYSIDRKKVAHLTVHEYSEFTDGSGRSNYAATESFVRA
jgi:hypothetical protein